MKKEKATLLFLPSVLLTVLGGVILFSIDPSCARSLEGKIFLQVEKNGEAWYVNPEDQKKYFLGRPRDAFDIMKNLGSGISNNDLKKIPIGLDHMSGEDSDKDGLPDFLEEAIGTDKNSADSDNDGYKDKEELENGYNPCGKNKLETNNEFINDHLGGIFLQTENNGEAWYVNPGDKKRYFLNTPSHAFAIMKNLGIGATNETIADIPTGDISDPDQDSNNDEEDNDPEDNYCDSCNPQKSNKGGDTPEEAIREAALNIKRKDTEKALEYFTSDMEISVKYVNKNLDQESRQMLADILLGAELSYVKSSNSEKIYTTEVQIGQYRNTVEFRVQKQDNGKWLMANL